MSLEAWLAFAAASAIMLAIPGPTILLVVSYALGHGRRTALATVSGVALGDFTAMTASLFGLGAVLAASAMLFTVLKWIGGAYLIWLGIKLWRAPLITEPVADNDNLPEEKSLKIFLHAYIVTALNPKSIVFFVAFVPQFLNPAKPFFEQMVIMELTFLVLAAINASTYALLANAARGLIRKASVQRAVNRTGGTLLIAAGAVTAGYRRIAA
ncbi:LysE family translocator [Rhizobium mongolense]|jgi:threonine/homoserine/homoserine lactone efflux protein|uniref:LysE family amino acid efflux protein n=2 Tax=Rhizobium gallicum TaxID=56730 RepID=A0A0B4X3X9_9HYPH|nr:MULTISPECIES: LysE family translocator [Rhizobium]TDW31793.1 threonine/homoserine/homoserine lactone efflux protein [Rhizobium azibense]AJD41836.1 LysE family amino acid efflux protein [Rhizobium gallicum bv. gallicum R602sp]APO68238.1 LysE family amino acid efflux protein [Rhizobium gallicum]NNH29426.1 LysE family translocator [Rhizobium sp. SEMIA 4085]QPB21866.1 LysE family translocator [Rhizobium sp. 007]